MTSPMMTARSMFLAPLLLAACGGRTLYSTATQVTPLAPVDAYKCAQAQFKALGYSMTAHDDAGFRLVGQKRDTVTRISSIQVRKILDQLEVQAKPRSTGDSELTIQARSVVELQNAGGLQQDQREASVQVKADAAALLEHCTAAAADSTVPQAGY